VNEIGDRVIGAAMRVHSALGAGLLESAYEACLEYELKKCSLEVKRQVALPIRYEEVVLDVGYRLDLLVSNSVVLGKLCKRPSFRRKPESRFLKAAANQRLSGYRLSPV
jgi:GxxExxY protein